MRQRRDEICCRHTKKRAEPSYQKLSWHVTFLARAPYQEWRMAMQYIEKEARIHLL